MKLPNYYFKVYSIDENGDLEDLKFFKNYEKAIQFKNDLIRRTIKTIEEDLIYDDEWGEYIEEVKEDLGEYEKITNRSYPIVTIENDNDNKDINYIPFYIDDEIETKQIVIELIEE